jgi:acetolactate synthase-1/2/3 large subunit
VATGHSVYALPGVHNDHLFDAFQRAGILACHPPRHEQGAGYMALGAAGRPTTQTYSVVRPEPAQLGRGLAHRPRNERPRAGLIGQIPAAAIGKHQGHLRIAIRGILARLVDHSFPMTGRRMYRPGCQAIQSMGRGRPRPAALGCAIDVGASADPFPAIAAPSPRHAAKIDEGKVRAAAKLSASEAC